MSADETTNEPEVLSVEDKAAARGWKPESEWEGDPDLWVGPKEFLARGQLMDTIHERTKTIKSQTEELAELKSTVKQLHSHYDQWAKSEVDARLKQLKRAKAEAMSMSDHETVVEIDEQIDEIKTESKKIETAKAAQDDVTKGAPPLPPEVQNWLGENPWADENSPRYQPDLAQEAISLLHVEVSRTGVRGVPSLNAVKAKMEKLYPEHFPSSRKRTSGSVDAGNVSRKGSANGLVAKLDEVQRSVGLKFVKAGAYEKLEDYAEVLHKMGEI